MSYHVSRDEPSVQAMHCLGLPRSHPLRRHPRPSQVDLWATAVLYAVLWGTKTFVVAPPTASFARPELKTKCTPTPSAHACAIAGGSTIAHEM